MADQQRGTYHENTTIEDVLAACASQKHYFESGATLSLNSRKDALKRIKLLIEDHKSEILEALKTDLQKPVYEAYVSEIGFLLQEVNLALRKLKKWTKVRRVDTGILAMPSRSKIIPQPLGVCLIIAPWNYPFHLVIAPLIAALAAGNTAIVKPAEHTPATGELLKRLLERYFESKLVKVVLGDGSRLVPEMMDNFRFDHIFFTGSSAIGRVIAKQAAEKLVPVTLELGGKNPCIIDRSANIKIAAQRVLWAKLLNAGQTCIAPDYLLVHRDISEQFQAALTKTLKDFYPEGAMKDENYTGIVDLKHLHRLVGLIKGANVIYGGAYDEQQLRMEPCIVTLESTDNPLMNEEIFGPILPVLEFSDITEAQAIVLKNPHPLSAYYFGNNRGNEKIFTERIQAGSMAINNAVVQFVNSNLPFGGVGNSGYGSYHGYYGFRTFSQMKPVMKSSSWPDPRMKYPPYSKSVLKLVQRLMK